jgi:hypothetical protein
MQDQRYEREAPRAPRSTEFTDALLLQILSGDR